MKTEIKKSCLELKVTALLSLAMMTLDPMVSLGAQNAGFICARQSLSPFGGLSGPPSLLKLAPSGDGSFELTYTFSAGILDSRQTTQQTISLGKGLHCQFSALDGVISKCISYHAPDPKRPFLQPSLQVNRLVSYSVENNESAVYESYQLTIVAPSVDDKVLSYINSTDFLAGSKKIRLNFNILGKGPSPCKAQEGGLK